MKSFLFHIETTQLLTFTDAIPAYERSKAVREFLHSESFSNFQVSDSTSTNEIAALLLYLDELAIQRLDVLTKQYQLSRSGVMREILPMIVAQYHGTVWEKGIKKTFTVAPGTLAQLKELIEHGERDSFIEEYLLNAYKGPSKSTSELKRRPKGGTELLIVTLSAESYEKLEGIAETLGDKVKRSHIFKDMIEQLIVSLSNEQRSDLARAKQQLASNINALKSSLSIDEIREIVETYLHEK